MLLKKKYRVWLELIIIVLVFFAIRLWVQRDVVKGVAPEINAITLQGKSFDLYQQKKRPILLHFWASWCPVCKLEQSSINNLAKDYPVITVAMQSGNDAELNQYMKDEKLVFNVINDESGQLSRKYRIKGVPVSFVISENNRIKFVEAGYTTELGLRLRLWWASL